MIDINQMVEIMLNSNNIKYYEDLGYEIPRQKDISYRITVKRGTKIKVKLKDLPKGSKEYIEFTCDYCGKKDTRMYYSYWNCRDSSIVKKDCCNSCTPIKRKEVNNIKCGNDSGNTPESIKKRSKKRRTNFEQIKKEFADVNFTLLISEEEFVNSNIPLPCICNNHPNIIQYKPRKRVTEGFGCRLCADENNRGENSPTWKGGISPLQNYLRDKIKKWKIDSFEKYNCTCVFTGIKSNKNIIHHMYSFSNIVYEILFELNYPLYDAINQYTEEELKQIEDKCLELHYAHGLGVCLSKPVHDLYHKIFGKGNNTPSQFTEFTQRYNNGEFNDLLNLSA